MQRAVTEVVRRAGLIKRASCYGLRHQLRTHLLEDGSDIRTVQELLGHRDAGTTLPYLQVRHRGAPGVESPMDRL